MTKKALLTKLERYEAALEEIAEKVQEQRALEAHQLSKGYSFGNIEFGRSDTYRKIAPIALEALGRERIHVW